MPAVARQVSCNGGGNVMTTNPSGGTTTQSVQAADLYNELWAAETAKIGPIGRLYPGLAVALLAALAAGFLAARYAVPPTLMGLLIGLALNFLNSDKRLTPGLIFASGTLLRWGIVLLGAKLTFSQFAALGPAAFLAIVAIAASVIVAMVLVSRALSLGTAFGVLAGSAIAICGASAALAVAALLGEKRLQQGELTMTLVLVSVMSAAAMSFYPLLAHFLSFTDRQAGFLMGAAIHDVAQSLGAGYGYSPIAGDNAAIVKMSRVALLGPVLAVLAFIFPSGGSSRIRAGVPWFVLGFFALAALSSLNMVPRPLLDGVAMLTTPILLLSITAAGIRSPMAMILKQGWKPFAAILCGTMAALALALTAAAYVI